MRNRIPDIPEPGEAKAMRLAAGYTATELAAKVGVSSASIHSWEAGKAHPNGLQATSYARALRRLQVEIDRQKAESTDG